MCKFGVWTCLSGPCDLMEGERIAVALETVSLFLGGIASDFTGIDS